MSFPSITAADLPGARPATRSTSSALTSPRKRSGPRGRWPTPWSVESSAGLGNAGRPVARRDRRSGLRLLRPQAPADLAYSLAEAVLILDEGQAQITLADLSEAPTRADGHLGL